MATDAAISTAWTEFEQLRLARQVLLDEAGAVAELANRLDRRFCEAVSLLVCCRGAVLVCGMGKAGLIGQKIAATLSSMGTRSHWLHPVEALHGDLGRVHGDDLVLILSYSGETEEVVRLCGLLRSMGVRIIAITQRASSRLGRQASVTLELGPIREACSWGLAPTSSTTAMLALGDALAIVTSRLKNFGREDFARFHPGGSLGRRLTRVEELMRPLGQCRIAQEGQTIREVLLITSKPGRRTGAIMLTDSNGRLTGIFTDSDLARLLERRRDHALDEPICRVMTPSPITITLGSRLEDAIKLLAERKISELPVVDSEGRPVGLIDVTDVVGLLPCETTPIVNPDQEDEENRRTGEQKAIYRVVTGDCED